MAQNARFLPLPEERTTAGRRSQPVGGHDDGAALETALALAERICANSPVAVRESLQVINHSIDMSDALAWQLSSEAAHRVRASEDSREGVAAFLEKRSPHWPGR